MMAPQAIRYRFQYQFLTWLFLLATALTIQAASAAPNGPTPLSTAIPDIVNGEEADEQGSLWQAALVYNSLPSVVFRK